MLRCVISFLALIIMGACSTSSQFYVPQPANPGSALYPASTAVSEGDYQKRDTKVSLKGFRFVYLQTDSNNYPGRFHFFVRQALARNGLLQVLSESELADWVKDQGLSIDDKELNDADSLRKLSDSIGPILLVQMKSMSDTRGGHDVVLNVDDLSTGKTVLRIRHSRIIVANIDKTMHYPVFNAFTQWVNECIARAERT